MNSEDMSNQFPQLMILRTCSIPAYSVPNSDAESSVATTSSSAELDRKEVDKADFDWTVAEATRKKKTDRQA